MTVGQHGGDDADQHQDPGEDDERHGDAQALDGRHQQDGGNAEENRQIGFEPEAADGLAAGFLEDLFVDNLLVVQFFAEPLHLLLHFAEGVIVVFHTYCIFLSCSLIRTSRTETFLGVMPTICPISS